MSPRPLLSVRGLTVEFPRRDGSVLKAVDDADLDIAPGEIHGLVGESGAGKSTVGAAIMGLVDPPGRIAAGDVLFKNRPLDLSGGGETVRGRDIGMIFQDPLTSLNPLFTIGSQIAETMRFHLPLGRAEIARRSVELLDAVGIAEPEHRLRQYPHHFSGGMRQRVVIAMALACDPSLVIADEPTTALDVSVQAQILVLIRDLCKRNGAGVLLVTHNIGVIAETADRVSVMYRGRVVETGATPDVLSRPEHPYTRSLIAAVPRMGKVLHRFPRIDFIEGGGNAPVVPARPRPVVVQPPTQASALTTREALEVRDLVVSFGKGRGALGGATFRAVDGVSFDVRPGETFGLVGESGSGKSTIANAIIGLQKAQSGSIRFEGADLSTDGRPGGLSRRAMQMVFQDPYASLNARMRVRDIVGEPLRFHGFAGSRAEADEKVRALLADVGLEADAASRYPHAFSGGQRQRISIARALACRPRFLVCDEPTSALDVSVQAQVLNLLKDLKDEHGLTLLLISHDLPVIRQMCDTVAVLRHGRLRELAPADTLFDAPGDPYTRELLALVPKLDLLDSPTNPPSQRSA